MSDKRFNPENAHVLWSEKRQKLLPSEEAIEFLQVKETDKVADLGAGNGYFTLPIAQKTKQKVYAVDIEQKMLDQLKVHADVNKVTNIHYVVSDIETITLDDNMIDKAFVAFAIHEVNNHEKVIKEINRVLKNKGQIVIIEWEKNEFNMGPSINEKISSQQMSDILKFYGFEIDVVHPLKSFGYVIRATNTKF
ncbi:class I SAM-dependent methyltransferase [Salirhabdus salicampi]|uniref:class I SAM-dependent methyltransferase n=1 Tax=Salirhabdus salicampi TaxID=476102 RepID=UPI0020C2CFD6|nr:methyltransferase domain-containing protein [Salirhabdus salicampi]MCP8617681.1 methyltransferase domain-containing protein [Salirhabdus salicampi]